MGFSRSQASKLVESLGGRVAEKVGRETDLVVAGTDPGSKFNTAKKYAVRIISERDFMELVSR